MRPTGVEISRVSKLYMGFLFISGSRFSSVVFKCPTHAYSLIAKLCLLPQFIYLTYLKMI
jgi:hypothetical protein